MKKNLNWKAAVKNNFSQKVGEKTGVGGEKILLRKIGVENSRKKNNDGNN